MRRGGSAGPHRVIRSPGVARAGARGILVVVVIGVPLWFAGSGGVPFDHVDPIAPLRAALFGGRASTSGADTGSIASWLGQVALVTAWVAWAWFVTCIALEARSWLSGRAPARLPGSRTMQWLVAGLVGAAFALGGMARSDHGLQPVGARVVGRTVSASFTQRVDLRRDGRSGAFRPGSAEAR